MRTALEISRISKRFVAGSGSCLATAQAVRDIDLVVAAGESVAIVGPGGSGKTTLLLCAAGLLTPDAGVISWFGSPHRGLALERAHLHYHRSSLQEPLSADEPHIHLVDLGDAGAAPLAPWIRERCEAGDAVIVALRDPALASRLTERAVVLRDGRVVAHTAARRVAERGFVDRPLRHV